MKAVAEHGGAVEAVPYMKARLVESNRERIAKIERGEIVVVGQNKFTETEDSPLTTGEDGGILTPDPEVERERIAALEEWRTERDQGAVDSALENLAEAARDENANIMPATIEAAKAGATTGEWAGVLRDVFGDYRAPTGVSEAAAGGSVNADLLGEVRNRVRGASEKIGHPIRILVGKPGLDGHSNGAEQIAVRARDVGMEVIYQGIRLTPEQIAKSAVQEDVDVVGLSILSGSHRELVPRVVELLRDRGRGHPRRRRRHHPRGRCGRHARGRRRRRLHAEGLRDQPDHGRDRGSGGRAPPRRAARVERSAGAGGADPLIQFTQLAPSAPGRFNRER